MTPCRSPPAFFDASSVENLRDLLPALGRVVLLERRARLVHLSLVLVQDHPHVARLGLLELARVLLVERLDGALGQLVLTGDGVLLDPLAEQGQAHTLDRVLLGELRLLEEALELLLVLEVLLLDLVEALLDLGVGDRDPVLLGLALDPPCEQEVGQRLLLHELVLRVVLGRDGLLLRRRRLLDGGVELLLSDRATGRVLDDRHVPGRDVGVREALRDGPDREERDQENRQQDEYEALGTGCAHEGGSITRAT